MAKLSAAPTNRVRVKRLHERGRYDAASVHAVLDANPVAHVGYVFDGQPYVTPTLQWREGDRVFWHGSAASRMLEKAEGADVCLTVTLIDGFVLARSAFHHSVNYRSVMVLGRAEKVTDPDVKQASLETFVNGLFPGRWDILRPATAKEMKATTVLSMPLDEASVKVRSGPPGDDEEDYALPIWAGVVPIAMNVLDPIADPRNLAGLAAPAHARDMKLG